jgi:hypothetical protein
MANEILPSPADMASWRRGLELAFSMLREIEGICFDETAYDGTFRDHSPQKNIVAAYLAKLKELNDARCELAFTAILTDHIASGMHSGTPVLEVCQEHYAQLPAPIAESAA